MAVLVCITFVNAARAAPSLAASLDRTVVPVSESVTLTLTFEGAAPSSAPSLPPLSNLSVTSVAQSSEFTIVNGQSTSRQSFNYTLVPSQPGDVTIPALQVQVGNQILTSQPLRLKIVPAAAPGNPEAAFTNLAFVRLIVPKNEVYLGEPFPVEIQLYWQSAREIQLPQLKADGFSLGQSAKPAQTTTQVGGVGYNLAIFKMSATAAKVGTLALGPAECNLTLLVPLNRRRRDPFDFFGPSAQAVPKTLASDAQTMKVLPLPTQNVPPTFNGTVGTFQLAVTAGPTNLTVGDPLTVKVQIAGRGRLDAVTLPDQPQWSDFKTYPATATTDSTDELGLTGVKMFTQVVIPENHEIRILPPFQFSFFDPNAKSYRTLSGPAIPLNVRSSGVASAPPPTFATNGAPTTPPPVDDIIGIKTRLDNPGAPAPLLATQPWFLGLQSVPVLAWLSLLIWRKRADALANNPRLRRQREVAQRIRAGLKELHDHAVGRRSEEFFATLFRLLQEQLGERLNLPASAITEAVIDERLLVRQLSEPTLNSLRELFHTCNQARYAPVQSSQELAALIPKLESVLRELQDIKA